MAKVSKEEAKIFLSHVPKEKVFWCANGVSFGSLEDLARSLNKVLKKEFSHHVNSEKNDFASWIYDVIGDISLANDLRKTTKKDGIVKKIKTRVASLKKIKDSK